MKKHERNVVCVKQILLISTAKVRQNNLPTTKLMYFDS
jgi:hypothetical protein